MLRNIYRRFRIVIALFLLSLMPMSEAAETNIQSVKNDLLGSWIVLIEGESRARTLNIHDFEVGQDDVWVMDATYGMTDEGQSTVKADVTIKSDGYRIKLVTQADSVIVAEFTDAGLFNGTFTSSKGKVRPLKLKKMSDEETAQRAKPIWRSARPKFKLPGADVPPSCAGLVGGWTGRWPHYGQTWLWVVEVDANCVATYAHRGGPNFPNASVFKKTQVAKGVLSSPKDDGGVDTFELHGEEVWARHTGSDGNNNAVFRKIQIEEK